jgi:hypothetical protein
MLDGVSNLSVHIVISESKEIESELISPGDQISPGFIIKNGELNIHSHILCPGEEREPEATDTTIQRPALPEGITEDMLAQWKQVFGDNIYMVDISGETYVYRGLMRAEFKQVAKQANMITNQVDSNIYVEEQNAVVGSIHPKITLESLNTLKAGIATVLSTFIMEASGFDDSAIPIKL